MAAWEKYNRPTEDGTVVEMQAPLIVSASRSTDIPAFYADWFFDRLQKGLYLMRIHGSSCFGLKTLGHC